MARVILLLAATEQEYVEWCVRHHYEVAQKRGQGGDRVLWVRGRGGQVHNLLGHDKDTTVWYTTGRWYLQLGAHRVWEALRAMYGEESEV